MSKFHKVSLQILDPVSRTGKVWLDDFEILGVRQLTLRAGIEEVTELTVTLLAGSVNAEVVAKLEVGETATLKKAARLVDEEASSFEEEAEELAADLGPETDENKEDWSRVDASRGRAISLRNLASRIRRIK